MTQLLPSRAEIVGCLAGSPRSMTPREIAKTCGVPKAGYERLLELLDQLTVDGSVRRVRGNRFKVPPERDSATWEGVLSVNPRGFGFVTAAGHDDSFIAAENIGSAMHGDRVAVTLVQRSSRGLEARIEAVVARRNPRVAGVLRRRGRSAWLEPDDTRVRGPIVVTQGAREGRDGDAAVVSITRFPSFADENPEGELVAVLGVPGDPNAEVAKILVREQIEEEHPEGAVREAEALAARIKPLLLEGRVDLRDVPLPTIDPEDARDHDDAIWVERHGDGYRAWIAIADVSEYVRPESELDKEALSRGCTIYLPDRAIPMLPAALAADLCSLLPDRDRLCMCVIADLDRQGSVQSFELVEGVMRSQAMLTYGGVARALGLSDTPPRSAQAESMKRELRVLEELARKLRKSRVKRGAIEVNVPEARVHLDPESGAPVNVTRRAQDAGIKRAYQMVEELMLLANELVAKWLSQRGCPTIYRVHGKPDENRLARLGAAAEKLAAPFDLEEMSQPRGVSRWLHQISDHPKRTVLEVLLLRSMKQAVYDIVNIGHFGLASDNYLHFTSPIRRYPDILVHRAVKTLLRTGKPDRSAANIEELRASATSASARERSAMDVEREVVDLYRTLLVRDRIGDVFEGTVSALVGSGMFVSLDEPFVDALVRFEAMGPDRYELDEDELSVSGERSGDRIDLGDRVVMTIEDVAVLRRTVYGRRVPPDAVATQAQARRGRRGRKAAVDAKTTRASKRGKGAPPGKKRAKAAAPAPPERDKTRRSTARRKVPPRKA